MQERCKIARENLKMAGVDDAFIRQKSARAQTTMPLLRAQSGFFFLNF
jgi:predicted O-methyltransferase YrrM